jgi:hypothetical protein
MFQSATYGKAGGLIFCLSNRPCAAPSALRSRQTHYPGPHARGYPGVASSTLGSARGSQTWEIITDILRCLRRSQSRHSSPRALRPGLPWCRRLRACAYNIARDLSKPECRSIPAPKARHFGSPGREAGVKAKCSLSAEGAALIFPEFSNFASPPAEPVYPKANYPGRTVFRARLKDGGIEAPEISGPLG